MRCASGWIDWLGEREGRTDAECHQRLPECLHRRTVAVLLDRRVALVPLEDTEGAGLVPVLID